MIRTFRHKGLQAFFASGTTRGIQARHAERLRLQLAALDRACGPNDLAIPGWRLHPLHGRLQGRWALWVDRNWRLIFAFIGQDIELLDYIDYH